MNFRISSSIPANINFGYFLLFPFYQWFLSNHIFWCTCLYVPYLAVNWASWVNGASLVAQMVKNLPTLQETQVWSLSQDDLLQNARATHSSILAWRIPWTEEPGRLQSMTQFNYLSVFCLNPDWFYIIINKKEKRLSETFAWGPRIDNRKGEVESNGWHWTHQPTDCDKGWS